MLWYYDLKESIKSIKFFFKTIWNHRWYDYCFFRELLDKQLEYLENHYGTKSHFIGDCFTKGRIKILRRYLEDWKECDKDCKEKKEKFFKYLGLNIDKFWD